MIFTTVSYTHLDVYKRQAQSYIHLKGHQDLQTRFKEYELYLATSEWETFGLTLLEAIGSGPVSYTHLLFGARQL